MTRSSVPAALRWTLAGGAFQRLLGLVGLGIIARLLAREDDGAALIGAWQQLISLHLVIAAFLPLGFDQLLVRETGERPRYHRALMRALAATAVLVAAGVLVFRAPLGAALDLGAASGLLLAVPIVVALQAARLAIKPWYAAQLDFRSIAVAESANTGVALLGGAALVAIHPRAESLYLAYALGELTEGLLLWRGHRQLLTNRVTDAGGLFRKHRRFSTVISLDQAVNVFGHQAPALLLAGTLGAAAVGVFALAQRLVTVPVYLLMGAVGRVALPALAGRPEAELRHRVLLALRLASATLPPVILWLVFFAPQLIVLVFGASWSADTAPILRWLGLALLFQVLYSPISVIDVLRDRPDVTLAWNLVHTGVRCAVLLGMHGAGMVAVIAWYSGASAALWLVYGVLLAWLLGAGQGVFFLAWARFVPLWVALAAGWWGIGMLVGFDGWLSVALSPLPALAYVGAVGWMDREVLGALKRLWPSQRPDSPPVDS